MSYGINVNIPAANNPPAQDQPEMQQNFSNISGYLTVDHVLPGASGNGYHKQVTLFTPIATPSPPDTVSVVYSKTISSKQQLFFKNFQDSAEYQLTGLPSSLGATASDGYATLPGGLIIQWGRATITSSPQPVNYPYAFPNAFYVVQLTIVGNVANKFAFSGAVSPQTALTGFNIIRDNGTSSTVIFWMALGA